MSQAPERTKRAGAASPGSARGGTTRKTRQESSQGERPPPMSPVGRHGVLRGLLLSVGNVLARDDNGSLSKVSLSILRKGLSDFLAASRLDEADEFRAAGTRRSGPVASTRGVTGGDDEKVRAKKKLQRRAQDDAITARLALQREEKARDGV